MLAGLLATLCAAQSPKEPARLLPQQFGGWEIQEARTGDSDPAKADVAYATALHEYGFQQFERAVYTKSDRKMTVKAARFHDASGAYGAFTLYKRLGMLAEKIGDQGASANEHILFYRGNILADVVLDRVTAMSAAELRELAQLLPVGSGDVLKLPTLPTYLPQQAYVKHSAKYVLGAAGLQAAGGSLPADLIDFGRSAEVVLGQYGSSRGTASLTLISYPTPQIAAERLRAIEAYAAAQAGAESIAARRTGPIVAVTTGAISADEAKSLLAAVNYDAEVTWSEATGLGKRDNIGNLVIAAFMLIGIIFLFALVFGLMFGGFRLLMKRLFPQRVFDRPDEVEIIRLNLRD